MIEGVRQKWNPVPVQVEVLKNTFFNQAPFRDVQPILANAFHIGGIDYRWKRGIVERLTPN
jgi:hypothetical protein